MLQCRDCSLESYITGLHITGGAGVGGGRGGEGGGGGGGGVAGASLKLAHPD